MNAFKKFGVIILKELSVERIQTYVLDTLIPIMTATVEGGAIQEIAGDEEVLPPQPGTLEDLSRETKDYLQSYGLSKVSIATVLRWMHAVGCPCKNRSKHYLLMNTRRQSESLDYQPVFTKRYNAHNIQACQWIQLSLLASRLLEAQDLVAKNCGYQYVDPMANVDMVEHHIDDVSREKVGDLIGQFGAQSSVRRDINKPIVMCIGQDEGIFKQFSFLSKMWTGPNGKHPLLPKDEGAGVMMSLFIREYGLIQELDQHTLNSMHAIRHGARYADKETAMDVNGTSVKPQLPAGKSPFLTIFNYGEIKEGYWDYNHMVLQFEDVVECLKVMHPH